MKNTVVLGAVSVLFLLSACASVIEGRSQEVVVKTDPAGASCTLVRNDTPLGTISPTPGTLYLQKTKDDISIKCTKKGYADASYLLQSGAPENNWLYILVGGPVGWGVDSATGSDNFYASPVVIELKKK
ncbi:MAG TPA: hypothetical protein DD400_02375 [Rhodospirillaceae bacterium]|nr:hypothetical protein [Rhodospirillaceae bacterium]